jgi:hypothetical protein
LYAAFAITIKHHRCQSAPRPRPLFHPSVPHSFAPSLASQTSSRPAAPAGLCDHHRASSAPSPDSPSSSRSSTNFSFIRPIPSSQFIPRIMNLQPPGRTCRALRSSSSRSTAGCQTSPTPSSRRVIRVCTGCVWGQVFAANPVGKGLVEHTMAHAHVHRTCNLHANVEQPPAQQPPARPGHPGARWF